MQREPASCRWEPLDGRSDVNLATLNPQPYQVSAKRRRKGVSRRLLSCWSTQKVCDKETATFKAVVWIFDFCGILT